MYKTDIERLVAQAQRVNSIANEVIEEAEILEDANVDTQTNERLTEKQLKLQEELRQAIADFNDAHGRSNSVGKTPEYDYGQDLFRFREELATDGVTIEYTGNENLKPSDANVTVTVGGSEINGVFTGNVKPGESVTIDTAGANDGDEVIVSWSAKTKGKKTLPGSASKAVDDSALPKSRLVNESPEFTVRYTIGSATRNA